MANKQEQYKKEKRDHESLAYVVRGLDKPNDDHDMIRAKVYFSRAEGSRYAFLVQLCRHSSSGEQDIYGQQRLGELLVEILNGELTELLNSAQELSRVKLEELRNEATDEAIKFLKGD